MYRDLGLLAARQEPLSSTKRPASEQDQAEVCQHLVEWVLSAVPEDKREAMTSMLEVRPSDENPNEGNAVFAKRDIALNELVMTVPRNRNISVTTAVNSPLVRLVASKFPFVLNTPVVLLALQLCAEAMLGDESTYKEYIAVLPSEFSIPLFFAPLTLKQLMYVVECTVVRYTRTNTRVLRLVLFHPPCSACCAALCTTVGPQLLTTR